MSGLPAAYAFTSGSTGADGALEPTQNVELTVPDNGTFNYTTINIPTGVTVTFKKNSSNSPIIMLATGDVTISGTINVNGSNGSTSNTPGAGGPGGYNGGIGGAIYSAGRRGEGSGGGGYGTGSSSCSHAGGGGAGGSYASSGSTGSYASDCNTQASGGAGYGNERTLPLVGGSGGGGGGGSKAGNGVAGGGGGGAILIASSATITLNGTISANGGAGAGSTISSSGNASGSGGGGSGGSIRLIANYISGSGSLSANGGSGGTASNYTSYNNGGSGGKGRIRLEAITVSSTLTVSPNPASIQQNIADNHQIFPTDIPTLTIASVGGVQVPSAPKGLIGAPDVSIPYNITNPVTVVVNAKNVNTGTTVTVKASPSSGSQTSGTGTLSGTVESSSASISLNISTSYPSLLTASVTIVVTAANGGPIYAEGEKVEKMRIETAMGGGQKMFYITESGREIPVTQYGS